MATAVNRSWASGIGADGQPVYAPRYAITVNGRRVYNPKDKHYRLAGYKSVIDELPTDFETPDGKHYEATGWAEIEGAIHRVYELRDNPPPAPRRWTRLSIKTALAQAGMLDAARQFLSASEIATGYTAWEALTDCDYIEEGYPDAEKWNALLDGAAQALGKTREEIDAFLDAIPTDA